MKDTNVNGTNLNTKFVSNLSWPEFKVEFGHAFDEKVLKYAYTLCCEAAGKKAVIKGDTPTKEGE